MLQPSRVPSDRNSQVSRALIAMPQLVVSAADVSVVPGPRRGNIMEHRLPEVSTKYLNVTVRMIGSAVQSCRHCDSHLRAKPCKKVLAVTHGARRLPGMSWRRQRCSASHALSLSVYKGPVWTGVHDHRRMMPGCSMYPIPHMISSSHRSTKILGE